MQLPSGHAVHGRALRGRGALSAVLGLLVGACGAGSASSSSPPPAPASRPGTAVEVPSFRHRSSRLVVASGPSRHRVRDVIALEGEAQLLEAKLAYGPTDKDLEDEDVDVMLVEDVPPGAARRLGTVRTSADGPGDDGGRARLRLAGAAALPPGRHRVRFVVRGDGSEVDGVVAVVPRGALAFVSDVDGTLTSSEWAELPAAIGGRLPAAHPGAARILGALAARGLLPVYLTARPDWLVPRTRAFLVENGFPEGVLITHQNRSGAFGDAAAAFKRRVLGALGARVRLAWAFGNTVSDAEAYASAVPDPSRRVLFRYTDARFGARRIDAYEELASAIEAPSSAGSEARD